MLSTGLCARQLSSEPSCRFGWVGGKEGEREKGSSDTAIDLKGQVVAATQQESEGYCLLGKQ